MSTPSCRWGSYSFLFEIQSMHLQILVKDPYGPGRTGMISEDKRINKLLNSSKIDSF